MKLQSFKQYITEGTEGLIDLGHGLWTYSYEDRLHGSIEGYNYLINNWGLSFKEEEKPKHTSQVASKVKDYFNIPFSTIQSKLTAPKSLFVESNKTLQIEFYRFIEPTTRAEIQNIFQKANEKITLDMNDKHLLKYMSAEDLYLYPNKGKKSSFDSKNDDYNKSRHEI